MRRGPQFKVIFVPRVFMLGVFLLASSSSSYPQKASPDLTQIINDAAEKRLAYINEFKNLLAQETKSFEVYGKNGDVKKRRSVVSTFIVYPLSRKEGGVAEFRNVISVDGKTLNDSEQRAQNFFNDVAKAESSANETDKIEKEGSRYDQEISINGLTLYQAPVLAENLRPFFDFALEGTDVVNGQQVHVISYRQSKDSPYVTIDPKRAPGDGKLTLIYDLDLSDMRSAVPRLNGKLWVDAASFRIRKESRTLTVTTNNTPTAVRAIETTLEYQNSSFEILTPRRLYFLQYELGKKAQDSRKDVSVAFDYTNFTKPDVEVKSADIKN